MIPQQTFEDYDIFGDGATKVVPDAAKRAAGFQQADVLPAEWMNWAWYKNSKSINDLDDGVSSIEAEINNVLSENNITPAENNSTQLFKAMQKTGGCIITSAATPKVVTGPSIEAGNVVKVMFGADVTGTDTTTGLLISYNGSNKPVKVNKNGTLVDFVAHTINGSTKYIQAYTTLEFVYDGVNLIIIGNPVVLSGTDYTIYADGKIGNESVGDVKLKSTNDIPYGWLEANGQAVSRTKYAELFQKYKTQTYDSDPTHTLLSRYGSGDGSTTFNLPDFREVALVGTGTNTVDTSNITAHEVYTLGEFKDDQLQAHNHVVQPAFSGGAQAGNQVLGGSSLTTQMTLDTGSTSGRFGNVTRGKRKGVIYLIKVL